MSRSRRVWVGVILLGVVAGLPVVTARAETPSFPAADCPAQLGENRKLTSSLLSDATHTVKRYVAGNDTRGGEVGCNYYDSAHNYNYGWTVSYLFSTTPAADVAAAVENGFGPLGGWDHPHLGFCGAAGVNKTVYAYVDCSTSTDAATTAGALAMLRDTESLAAPQASAPTATATPGPPPKVALCPEAAAAFTPATLEAAGIKDPAATGIHVDGKGLLDSFQSQIATFNDAHADAHAYVSNNTPGGSVGAIAWLFSNGGIATTALNSLYVTGNEKKLNDQMFALARVRLATKGPQLSPSDVFGMALDLEGGNVTQALLTAHNTVRALVRGDAAGVGVPGPASDFVNTSFSRIRDGEIGGPWYHLFGTAYLETVARGDWGQRLVGAYADASAYLDGAGGDPYEHLAGEYADQLPTASSLSSLANAVEQIYRENVKNDKGQLNKPDPEKYCFNVWGAQLGSALYKSLPLYTQSKVEGLFSSFTASVSSLLDLPQLLAKPRLANFMGSPYSVRWSDGARATVLDQGAVPARATLAGDLPIFVVPVLEDGSWGASWLSSGEASESVTFEAMRDGAPLHYARTDLDTGKTAYYDVTAPHTRDRYSVSLDSATTAPVMTGPNGTQVRPQVVSMASVAERRSSTAWLSVAAMVALILVVLVVSTVLLRRRGRGAERSL